MFEKKKKKRGERSYFVRYIWFALLIIYTVIGVFVGLSYIFKQPEYAVLPQKAPIEITGKIVDSEGKPVIYRNVRVNLAAPPDSRGSGGFENKSNTWASTFAGATDSHGEPSACLWGYIEIDGYPHHDYEFQLQHIEWGGAVNFTFIAADGQITVKATVTPSEIKPALAPDPAIHPDCQI